MFAESLPSPDSAEDARKRLSRLVEKVSNNSNVPTIKPTDSTPTYFRRSLLDFENTTRLTQPQRSRSVSPTTVKLTETSSKPSFDNVTSSKPSFRRSLLSFDSDHDRPRSASPTPKSGSKRQMERIVKAEVELAKQEFLQKESLIQNSLEVERINAEKCEFEKEYVQQCMHSLLMIQDWSFVVKKDISHPSIEHFLTPIFDSFKMFDNKLGINNAHATAPVARRIFPQLKAWFVLYEDFEITEGNNSKLFIMSNRLIHNKYSIFHEQMDRNSPIVELLSAFTAQQSQTLMVKDSASLSWLLEKHQSSNDNDSTKVSITNTSISLIGASFSLCPHQLRSRFSEFHYIHKVKCLLLVEHLDNIDSSLQVNHINQLCKVTQSLFCQSIVLEEKDLQNSMLSLVHLPMESVWENDFHNLNCDEKTHQCVKSLEDNFARILNARKASLLFSSGVLKSLGLLSDGEDSLLFRYTQNPMSTDSFEPIWDCKHGGAYSWLKDLQDGKLVVFNPPHSEPNLRHLQTRQTSNYSFRTFSSDENNLQLSRMSLQSFLLNALKAIEETPMRVESSMIIPINTSFGLVILIIVDQCDNSYTLLDDIELSIAPNYPPYRNTSIPFTTTYANTVSHCCNSFSTLTTSILRILCQEYATNRYVNLVEKKLENCCRQNNRLVLSWEISHNIYLKKHYYGLWKCYVSQTKQQKKWDIINAEADLYKEVLDFRTLHGSDTSSGSLGNEQFYLQKYFSNFDLFLSKAEYTLRKLFPEDYVIIDSQESMPIIENLRILYDRGDNFEVLTETIKFDHVNGRSSCSTFVLQRNVQLKSKISSVERICFTKCCSSIGSIYDVLKKGFHESSFIDHAYELLLNCESQKKEISCEKEIKESLQQQLEQARSQLLLELKNNIELKETNQRLSMIINACSDLAFSSESYEQLSQSIWNELPKLLKCESVLLVLNESYLNEVANSPTHKYKILWPSDKSKHSKARYNSSREEREYLSFNQLVSMPPFEANGAVPKQQSAIPMNSPDNELFGALLIFYSSNDEDLSNNFALGSGDHELLVRFVSMIIYHKIVFFRFRILQEHHNKLEISVDKLYVQTKNKEQSIEELKSKLEIAEKSYYDSSQNSVSLLSKIEQLEGQYQLSLTQLREDLDSNKQYYEKVIGELNSYIKTLESSADEFRQQQSELLEQKKAILQIIEKFAFDDRCHQEKYVWYWLREIAQSREGYFYFFSDKLTKIVGTKPSFVASSHIDEFLFPPALYHEINGLFASIGESNRTRKCVHFKSFVSSSFATSDLKSNTFFANNSACEIDILCIPNRAAMDCSDTYEPGCFLFFKQYDAKLWKGFSNEDCEILDCACNVVSRVLQKDSSANVVEEYSELKQNYHQSMLSNKVILDALTCGKSLLDKPLHSLHDLNTYIKDSLVRLCNESSFKSYYANRGGFSYESSFIITSSASFEKRIKSLNLQTQELITKSKSSKMSHHCGSIAVFPIIIKHEVLFGIVIIEKKFLLDNTFSLQGNNILPVDYLSITDLEAESFSILLCFVSYMVDRVHSMKEAYQSVREATVAVNTIQSNRLLSEDRLSDEIAIRLQYEEVLKRGHELFARVSTKRTSVGQIIDIAKRSITSISGGVECFILLPYNGNTVFNDLLFEIYSEMGSSDVAEWLEKGKSSGFYTLVPDDDMILDVTLEPGDIEAVSVSSNRSVFFPSKPMANSNNVENYSIWHSWAIRRVQSKISSQISNEAQLPTLFSLAVPFHVQNKQMKLDDSQVSHALVGCVVVVRTSSPFSDYDRECISHLNQILSCCFKIKQGIIQTESKVLDFEKLQHELFSLRKFKHDLEIQEHDQVAAMEKIVHFDDLSENIQSFSKILQMTQTSQNIIDNQHLTDKMENCFQQYAVSLIEKIFPFFSVLRCTETEWSDLRFRENASDGISEYRKEVTLKYFGTITIKFGILSRDGVKLMEHLNYGVYQNSFRLSEHAKVILLRLQSKANLKYHYFIGAVSRKVPERTNISLSGSYMQLKLSYLIHCLEVFSCFCVETCDIARCLHSTVQEKENLQLVVEQHKKIRDEEVGSLEKKIADLVKTEKAFLVDIVDKKKEKLKRIESVVSKLNMSFADMLREINHFDRSVDMLDVIMRVCLQLSTNLETNFAFGKVHLENNASKQIETIFEWLYNSNCIALNNSHKEKIGEFEETNMIHIVVHVEKNSHKDQLSTILDNFLQKASQVTIHIDVAQNVSNMVWIYIPKRFSLLSKSIVIIFRHNSPMKSFLIFFIQSLYNIMQSFCCFRDILRFQEVEDKLSISKRKLQSMDQLTADWTQLVKGLNGSSSAVVGGVKSIWARASNTMVSILSSNCVVLSCGLILQNNTNEKTLTEYVIRDLSTPFYPSQQLKQNSRIDQDSEISAFIEYANANLDQRSARDLGSKIHLMLLDIFEKHSTEQRIYKTVYDTHSQIVTQESSRLNAQSSARIVYFVPVRTAYNIHGVLRLSIELPYSQISDLRSENIDQSALLSSIENNMVNFAEAFAPLLISARLMEDWRQRNELAESNSRDQALQIVELSTTMNRLEHYHFSFLKVIEECSNLLCHENTNDLGIFKFCEQFLGSIRNILGCNAELIIHPELVEGMEVLRQSALKDSNVSISSINNQSVVISTLDKLSSQNMTPVINEAQVTSILILPHDKIAGKFILHCTDGMDRNLLNTLMPALSKFLTAIINEITVECSAKDKVVLAVDSLKTMKETFEREQIRLTSLVATTEELTLQIEQQLEWTKLTSESLKYVTSIENHAYRLPAIRRAATYSLNSFNHLFSYLSTILLSLKTILFPHACFNVAILNGQNADSDLLTELIWVYGEGDDSSLTWSQLTESSKIVARNIVNLCVRQRMKSEIEVRQLIHSQSNLNSAEISNTIHIMALPLWHSYTGEIIGSLVILQHIDSFNYSETTLAKFCDVGSIISRVISHEIVEFIVEESYIQQEATLIEKDSKIEEHQKLHASMELLIENQKELHSRDVSTQKKRIRDENMNMKSIFSRYRKLYKVVCRESSTLLDPPIVGNENTAVRATHPASITPIAALQDSCLKVLSLLRNLLRAEGQAILLKDVSTSPPTYQIIYSGTALSWPGIEPNTFGVITSRTKNDFGMGENAIQRSSLVETSIMSRKSMLVANAPLDDRYFSQVDGICALGTPMLLFPLKGKNGAIVGVAITAKSKDSSPFSIEDIAAGELIVGMGALSIYWCQGLGTMHHQLLKTVEKLERLEKSVVVK